MKTFANPLTDNVLQDANPGMTWEEYEFVAEMAAAPYKKHYREESFQYIHPVRFQSRVPERFQTPYGVKIGYSAWGDPSNPLIICSGGIVNVAHRFNDLAMALRDNYYVVCPDWVGRGNSGWMRDQSDYSFETYVEQTRQLMAHLGARPVIMLGSSLGGSVAIELAQDRSSQIARLILNDVGPFIPSDRRTRRAEALARHYVFISPAEILRKTGVSQKNDGPVHTRMRILISHEQTKWCDANGGRIYRYDIRAMQEYQSQADLDVDQWQQWKSVTCPVLAIHGMQSDALLSDTIQRMQSEKNVTLMHVPDAGHTPALGDPNQIWLIQQWLSGGLLLGNEFSATYSRKW